MSAGAYPASEITVDSEILVNITIWGTVRRCNPPENDSSPAGRLVSSNDRCGAVRLLGASRR